MSERYRVTFRRDLFARTGFLAGSDERRLDELCDAILDDEISAIATARGGHGLLRIIHRAPWAMLRKAPKWIVGFSDPTALHVEAARIGVASLHAANIAGLGRGDAATRTEWLQALEHPLKPRLYSGQRWSGGCVRGPLVGGNLTILTMMAAAGRLTLPAGCILAIEDVTETSYRIDRMLAVLTIGGHLDRVAGFALGQFTDCSSGVFKVQAETVLHDALSHLRPTVAGLVFGHGHPNRPLTFGPPSLLDADRGLLVNPS